MRWITEENLRKWIITDGDKGCGYIDERDIDSMEWVEDKADKEKE